MESQDFFQAGDGAVLIWICLAVVFMVAIGWNGIKKLQAFNRKHKLITFDNTSATFGAEDSDDDDDWDNITIYE